MFCRCLMFMVLCLIMTQMGWHAVGNGVEQYWFTLITAFIFNFIGYIEGKQESK